jgi:hypothetical protein
MLRAPFGWPSAPSLLKDARPLKARHECLADTVNSYRHGLNVNAHILVKSEQQSHLNRGRLGADVPVG